MSGLGAQFRQGVAEATTRQHFAIQPALLLLAAVDPEDLQCIEMVLRDLPQGAVGLGDQADDPG
ncbi:hypothetical protein D3C75_1356420 [compost metagenome]